MAKKKTLKKQGFCFDAMPAPKINKRAKTVKHNPSKSFKSKKKVALALFHCLEENDPESFIEILDAYLEVNGTELAKISGLPRSTINHAFSAKGNPSLKTLAKIVHETQKAA